MIAEVIIDVLNKQVNHPFDYLIPAELEENVLPGMRVIVPFSHRKCVGFVVGIKDSSTFSSLCSIDSVLDLEPLLNEELLKLSKYMSEDTYSFWISSLKTILPNVFSTKIKKRIVVLDKSSLPKDLLEKLESKKEYTLSDKDSAIIPMIRSYIAKGALKIEYDFERKDKPQMKTELTLVQPLSKYKTEGQKKVIERIENAQNSILMETLTQEGYSLSSIRTLCNQGVLQAKKVEVYRTSQSLYHEHSKEITLNEEQKNVIESINMGEYHSYVLHGVTGSGKTEVYLNLIEKALNEQKQAIVLVPEISLTPQTVFRFKKRFGDLVSVFHSGLTNNERYDEWRKIYRNETKIVVGARSAIFVPFTNIGVIIIDEEHEDAYKQEDNPKYDARSMARYRAKYHNCPLVLGSATPLLTDYYSCRKEDSILLEMKHRANQKPMPEVKIISMIDELKNKNKSIFSRDLKYLIQKGLEKHEQSLLLLNRRGHANFVMCRSCGEVIHCPHCDVSLTFHKNINRLICHTCGYQIPMPEHCPTCNSTSIRYVGIGTEKVEEELKKEFPSARIIRMDHDTTSNKGDHERLITSFQNQEADILVGTQMIAKGLDFPNVTLVGVLLADMALNYPDYRSSEKTFELLTQVSGRAGRSEKPGNVVIQCYNTTHYSIECARNNDYLGFYLEECKRRKMAQYPPFKKIIEITISHKDRKEALKVASSIEESFREYEKEHLTKAILLGPIIPYSEKKKDYYRVCLTIKLPNDQDILNFFDNLIEKIQSNKDLLLSIDKL